MRRGQAKKTGTGRHSDLVNEIRAAWSAWSAAGAFEPSTADAPSVAKVLDALHRAVESRDGEALRKLEDSARRSLGETSERGGRRADRAEALEFLAETMDGLLGQTPRLAATELAYWFVLYATRGTGGPNPISRWLLRSGAVPVLLPGVQPDSRSVATVEAAFDNAMSRPNAKARPDGERLVVVGLAALGFPGTKNLYSYRWKQTDRASKR